MYDFGKTRLKNKMKEFRHKYFVRDRPDLLQHIKRKPILAKQSSGLKKSTPGPLQKDYDMLKVKYEMLKLEKNQQILPKQKKLNSMFESSPVSEPDQLLRMVSSAV